MSIHRFTPQRKATIAGRLRISVNDEQKKRPGVKPRAFCSCSEGFLIRLGRPGGDLLSHALRRSTISAGDFNDRVRDGIGWRLPAITTRPAKTNVMRELFDPAQRAPFGAIRKDEDKMCNLALNDPYTDRSPRMS